MQHQLRFCTHIILIAAATAVLAGCGSEEPVASNAATGDVAASTVPTYAQIQAAVILDEADAAVVRGALAEWRDAAGRGVSGPATGHPRPPMAFVAAVAPSLDSSQLEDLVGFLVEHRETHMRTARERYRGEERGEHMHERLAASIGLSAGQQAALRELHRETRQAMRQKREAFRAGTITEEQMEEAMQALHASQREKLAGILSTEQMARLDAMREERHATRVGHRIERMEARNEAHVEWLTAVLGLSDAQKSQVRAALSSLAETRKVALKASASSTLPPRRVRLELRDEYAALEKELEGILTEEQSARLKIVRQLHPAPRDL